MKKEIKAWAIIPNEGEYQDLQPENHYFLFPTKKLADNYLGKANWQGKVKIIKVIIQLNFSKVGRITK